MEQDSDLKRFLVALIPFGFFVPSWHDFVWDENYKNRALNKKENSYFLSQFFSCLFVLILVCLLIVY